jgi:hypothetical protein
VDQRLQASGSQWIINLVNIDFVCVFETVEGRGQGTVVRVDHMDTKPFSYPKRA